MTHGFTKRQHVFMDLMFRYYFGFQCKPVEGTLSWFSKVCKMPPPHVSTTINELVLMRVITKTVIGVTKTVTRGGMLLEINTNIAEWRKSPKTPAITKTVTQLLPKRKPVPLLKKTTTKKTTTGNETAVAVVEKADSGITRPKPPRGNNPIHILTYWFFEMREKYLQDEYYEPYEDKHLKLCKLIIEKKAKGNTAEVMRRAKNLIIHASQDGFFDITPMCLSSQWARLHQLPKGKISNESVNQSKIHQRLAEIRNRERSGQ